MSTAAIATGRCSHMKAAVYTKTKSGKVLEIRDVATPVPKDDQVLIGVRATSVNPLDWRLKSPRPGVDLAGEVVAVGQHVQQFRPGDAVFGTGRGAFAEFACASESALLWKPENLTFEQAACTPIAGLTALQGLRDHGHLQAGQKVLINGAAGGIGTFAVQIAKFLGAEVTGVCSTRNIEMVRSLGADFVIDYTKEDFTLNRRHYHLLLDNVGNRSLSECRRVMASHGRCVLAGAPKTLWPMITRVLKAFAWSPWLPQKFMFFIAKMKKDHLAALCELMVTGKVTPVIDKRYRLTDLADAIAYVEQGHARAKVVVTLG
jgi:NADPH:quinone reductase-like Zn-dependent oxidoreductase